MYKLLFLFLLFSYSNSFSHPGIGIVKDSKGFIYYTDLERVWKVNPTTLAKTVVVPNVHTHQLYMDGDDNLFGEGSLYSGEQKNLWSHYIWKLNKHGRIDTAVPLIEGFFIDKFTLVADKEGNQYWNQHWKTDKIIKRKPNGETEVLAEGDFKKVQWMFPLNNKLYFIQEDDVYVIDKPGNVQIFAPDLAGKKSGGHNAIFGLWSDKHSNIYVANSDYKKVLKLTSDGKVTDIYESAKGWFPTGGLFEDEGYMWLLECSASNEIRVQKIDLNNQQKIKSQPKQGSTNFIFFILTGVIISAFILFLKYRKV